MLDLLRFLACSPSFTAKKPQMISGLDVDIYKGARKDIDRLLQRSLQTLQYLFKTDKLA